MTFFGDVIIPVRVLRDEGASYKYLAPGRYIDLNKEPVRIFEQVLDEYEIPYMECTTWSTDGFYRETKELLYSGDILVGTEKYDDRNWYANLSAREKIFQITLESLIRF